MAIPHFFSVERQGYKKVSDLFADVLKDMLDHGFTKINISHGTNASDLTSVKTTIVSQGNNRKPGTKLYIKDGTRPVSPGGVTRSLPWVEVKTVTINGLPNSSISANGPVASTTDVRANYDPPFWDVMPTGSVKLYANIDNLTDESGTTVTLSSVTISRGTLDGTITNAPDSFGFTLEAGPLVDPLNGTTDPNSGTGAPLAEADRQPWRINFNIVDDQKVNGSVATHLQMYYDAELGRVTVSKITDDEGDIIDNVGAIGAIQPRGVFSDNDLNQGFYNRKVRVSDQPQTFPLSYLLTITDRGFFLGIWEGTWSTVRGGNSSKSNYFNWVLVQRPVDRITGKALTSGKAPVFHVNSVNYKYYKAVVRESDVLHPTSGPSPKPAFGTIDIHGLFSADPAKWFIRANIDPQTSEIEDFGNVAKWKDGSYIYDEYGIPIGKLKAFHGNGAMRGNVGTRIVNTTLSGEVTIGNIYANLYARPNPPFGYETNLNNTEVNWGNLYIPLNNNKPIASSYTKEGIKFYWSDPNVLAYRVLADEHSPDSHMIFNGIEQVSLTEDKTYLLSFPHNLTTPRFRYTEELDMIGCTSSDVVMAGQDIQFTTYGELGPRTYRAMPANSPLNTGFRIAALIAPQGPRWVTAAGQLSAGTVNTFSPGDTINIPLQADKVPDDPNTPVNLQRGRVTFEVVRGTLPEGIALVDDNVNFRLFGELGQMEYTEATNIKFTIAARNASSDGDGGFALREFWITYVPL